MPIYSYRCLKCGRSFENLFISGADNQKVECPSCGSEDINKVFSKFNVGKSSPENPGPCGQSCPGGCGLDR